MHANFHARPYQVTDLATLINAPRTGLFHEPGAGKTYIAAMYTEYIYKATGERIVWTQPGGIMAKNRNDILFSTNFAPEEVAIVQGTPAKRKEILANPDIKVFLMSGQGLANEYELLPRDVRHMVCDEIHLYYTTHGSARTTNWYRACKRMGAIVPMTGTVIRGRLDTAYPIMHVLAPHLYGSDRQFLAAHAWFDDYGKICGWKNHERLKLGLQSIGIFRSFKSIYGEEQKVFHVINCRVPPQTYSKYLELEAMGMLEMSDEFVDAGNPAVTAIRARQILAIPEAFEIDETSAKDEIFSAFIDDCIKSEERVAIFSAHTKEQERLVKLIKGKKGRVGHINGTVPNEKRQQIDREFTSGDLQFVVASAATAGIGFNWAFLNTMIFYSLDYTDDSFIQAYRRGIRGVRETPLRIIVLHYPGTIEDRVLQIVDRKSNDHHLINPDLSPTTLYKLAMEGWDGVTSG